MVKLAPMKGYTVPFHAPLYTPPPWIYRGAEVLVVVGTVKRDRVEALLPDQVKPASDPLQAAVWIAKYPFSTLGPYSEAIIAVQVEGPSGLGYYIPYIYVDSDAALAAGREVLGAPKKLAKIEIGQKGLTVCGRVERNSMYLLEAAVKLESRAPQELFGTLLPEKLLMYGLRVLPPVGGKGLAQLVEWYVRVWPYTTPSGIDAWTGPATVKLEIGPEDPLAELAPLDLVAGFFIRIDMELGVVRVAGEAELH